MWGRITHLAEKLDDTFGTDGGLDNNSSQPSSQVDGDGWDDADDFDDDLDFDTEPSASGNDHEEEKNDLAVENHSNMMTNKYADENVQESPPVEQEVQVKETPPNALPFATSTVTASAPGKALIAGGYLVLECPNPGVVLAAKDCKFHCTVTFRPILGGGGDAEPSNGNGDWASVPVDVYSPQFDQVFSYFLSYSFSPEENHDDAVLRLRASHSLDKSKNKFIEKSLLLSLGYLRNAMGPQQFHSVFRQRQSGTALGIKLRADNDFYSQIAQLKRRGLELTPQNVAQLESFLPCPRDEITGKVIVNKTGLGSSAALVTSLVGGLLQFFGVVSLPSKTNDSETLNNGNESNESEGLRVSHNLAQVCHCYAQGKIGSGFDVSSAIYGSHVYTRFSKDIIDAFLEGIDKHNCDSGELWLSDLSSRELCDLVDDKLKKWDCTVTPFTLPKGLEIIMADICGGSESPSMAKKVLDWKKNSRKVGFLDDYYWKDLKRCNNKVASLLTKEFTSSSFIGGLKRDGEQILANRTAEQWKKPMPSSWHEFAGSSWDVAGKLLDLRMALLESRQNLKGMGNAAGVPIEPDIQTELANATMKLPGVIAAGVPGAGGYDALFVIYVKGKETADGKSDQVRDDIGNLWKELSEAHSETVVCPLSARAAGFGGEDGLCITRLDW